MAMPSEVITGLAHIIASNTLFGAA